MKILTSHNFLNRQYIRLRIGRKRLKAFKDHVAIPYLSRGEIREIQAKRLQHILRTAVETVPFSQNIKVYFANFSLKELSRFSIVNKDLIQKEPKKGFYFFLL